MFKQKIMHYVMTVEEMNSIYNQLASANYYLGLKDVAEDDIRRIKEGLRKALKMIDDTKAEE